MQNNNWINVKDRLPETDDDVVILGSKWGTRKIAEHTMLAWYDNTRDHARWTDERGNDVEQNADYWYVTHWLPIPEYPELSK